MIRDKLIQKWMKGKVLAVAMTAFMASLFVPMVGNAADLTNPNVRTDSDENNPLDLGSATTSPATDYIIRADSCPNNTCSGHYLYGDVTGHSILVQGGIHDIYFTDDVSIVNETNSPITLSDGADVVLHLRKGKTTTLDAATGFYAGINVTVGTSLTIEEYGDGQNSATLNAKGGPYGAGIGAAGDGSRSTGSIIIESGTINATGGEGAAGIGSLANGVVESITIKGGNVTAIGGSAGTLVEKGAAGIGCGTEVRGENVGNVSIAGGKVKAIGGSNDSNDSDSDDRAPGIRCYNLTSKIIKDGKEVLGNRGVIITTKLSAANVSNGSFANDFNGFIWQNGEIVKQSDGSYSINEGKQCFLWGNAEVYKEGGQDSVTLTSETTLYIQGGSLTVSADDYGQVDGKWVTYGKIEGEGKIINADRWSHQGKLTDDSKIIRSVELAPRHIMIPEEKDFPTFTGNDLRANLIQVQKKEYIPKNQTDFFYTVDDDGYECVITKDGDDTDTGGKIIDAGKYTITFVRESDQRKVTKTGLEVKQRPLSECKMSISTTEKRIYTGNPVELTKDELVVTYEEGKYPLTQGKDYTVRYDNNTDASRNTSEKQAKVTISAWSIEGADKSNFSGSKEATFIIDPAPLTEETVDVDFDVKDHTYNNEIVRPVLTVTNKNTDVQLESGTDYELDEVPAFRDAGIHKITINSTKNGNYDGSLTVDYVIKKAPVNVVGAVALEPTRPYDATSNIRISEIKLDSNSRLYGNVTIEDLEESLDYSKVIAQVVSSDAGYYDNVVSFSDLESDADVWKNYCIVSSGSCPLTIPGDETSGITITPLGPPDIKLAGKLISNETSELSRSHYFETSVNSSTVIDPASHIYYCAIEVEEGKEIEEPTLPPMTSTQDGTADIIDTIWKDGGARTEGTDREPYLFTGLKPNTTYNFYAFVAGTRNVETSGIVDMSYDFGLIPRTGIPTEDIGIDYVKSADGETYTLTITAPGQQGPPTYTEYPFGHFLYGFDGEKDGTTENTIMTFAEPGETYTAYVQYNKDTIFEPSPAKTRDITLPSINSEDVSAELKPRVNNPKIIVNGKEVTPDAEGNIEFWGEASVELKYEGYENLSKVSTYYTSAPGTTAAPAPTTSSTLYEKPILIKEDTSIHFMAARTSSKGEVVAYSDQVQFKMIKQGEADDPNNPDNPNNPSNSSGISASAQPLNEASIANTQLESKGLEEVKSGLATTLGSQGYTDNTKIIYFDLNVLVEDANSSTGWRTAEAADFAKYANEGGMLVDVPISELQKSGINLPSNVKSNTHSFGMSHMFSTTVGSNNAGDLESIAVTGASDGTKITFRVKGTSPYALAYQTGGNNGNDQNGGNGDDQNGGNGDNQNGSDGNNGDGGDGQVNAYGRSEEPGTGTGADGTGGTTTGTDAGTQGASNDAANALSNIMPKTGDPLSFVPWIAAAVVSVGAIVFFATRKKGKKKQIVKKTQAAKKKK